MPHEGRGKERRNSAPPRGERLTLREPPWFSMVVATMKRPTPEPSGLVVWRGILSRRELSRPGPLSPMTISMELAMGMRSMAMRREGEAWEVMASTALRMRLPMATWSWASSPAMRQGESPKWWPGPPERETSMRWSERRFLL